MNVSLVCFKMVSWLLSFFLSCFPCLLAKGTTRCFKNTSQLAIFVQRLCFRASTDEAIGGDDVGDGAAAVDGVQNFLNVAIARFATFVQFDQSEIDTDC